MLHAVWNQLDYWLLRGLEVNPATLLSVEATKPSTLDTMRSVIIESFDFAVIPWPHCPADG
jgi:hypothetical protein